VFERFGERARRAVALAIEEAHASQRNGEPGHLLIGLAREGRGVAALLLAQAGLDEQALRRSLGLPEPAEEPPSDWAIAFSPEAADVVRAAVAVADERRAAQVATEHLLLALVRVAPATSAVGELLGGAGLDESRIAAELARLAHAPVAGSPGPRLPAVEPRALVEIRCPACGSGRLELAGGDVQTSQVPLGVEARGLAGCTACGAAWEVDYLARWRPLELPPGV
jgi:ATP-dependent Clp protease ATP-binding subunit ClpA